jgi:hypothetical protein
MIVELREDGEHVAVLPAHHHHGHGAEHG